MPSQSPTFFRLVPVLPLIALMCWMITLGAITAIVTEGVDNVVISPAKISAGAVPVDPFRSSTANQSVRMYRLSFDLSGSNVSFEG
jgi:hypothetical protein